MIEGCLYSHRDVRDAAPKRHRYMNFKFGQPLFSYKPTFELDRPLIVNCKLLIVQPLHTKLEFTAFV